MAESPPVVIDTLGDVRVSCAGRTLALRAGRDLALLVYLAWANGRGVPRDALAKLLWDAGARTQRLHSLSQLLYRLNTVLPAGGLVVDGGKVSVDVERVRLDAAAFLFAVRTGRAHDAVQRYTGEFLSDFHLRGASNFSRWQEDVRSELRRSAEAAVSEAIVAYEQVGDWHQLELGLRQLILWSPESFANHRRLVRVLLLEGKYAEARLRCLSLKGFSSAGYCTAADYETLSGEVEARAHEPDSGAPTIAINSPRFVGRRREQEYLRAELASVIAGEFRVVAVRGAAGVGKTRLCEHFLRYCVLHGVRVVADCCRPAGRRVPYSGLGELLSSIGEDELSGLPPEARRSLEPLLSGSLGEVGESYGDGTMQTSRRQLFHGIECLLRSMTSCRPVVLFLDDFQWADDSSAAVVERLTRKMVDVPLMILLAARPEEMRSSSWAAPGPAGARAVRTIHLDELETADALAMIAAFEQASRQAIPEPVARTIADRAGGHPLFLLELLRVASEVGDEAQRRSLGEDPLHSPVPPNVEEYLRGRFAQLSTSAQALIEALAVVGSLAEHDVVRQIADLAGKEYVAAAEEVVATGLVSDKDRHLAFRHDLVREAAYTGLSGARRNWLHGRAGILLEARPGVDAAVLATHFDLGGVREEAASYAQVAATAAKRVWALPEVEHMLRVALRNVATQEARAAIAEELADCLRELGREIDADKMLALAEQSLGGDPDDPIVLTVKAKRLSIAAGRKQLSSSEWAAVGRIISLALAPGGEPDRLGILRFVLPLLWDGGQVQIISGELQKALVRLEEMPPNPLVLTLLANFAQVIAMSDGPAVGLAAAERVVHRAEQSGDPPSVTLALLARGLNFHCLGQVERAVRDYEAALRLVEQSRLERYKSGALNCLAVTKAEGGDYEAADTLLKQALAAAEKEGSWRDYAFAEHNRAFYVYDRGSSAEARQMVELALRREMLGAWYNEAGTWALLGLSSLDAGDLTRAQQARSTLQTCYDQHRAWGPDLSYIEIFLARMEAAEGHRTAALARLSEVISAYQRRDVFCLSRVQLEKARMLVDADPEEARRLAREVRSRGSDIGAQPLMDRSELLLRQLRTSVGTRRPAPRRRP